MYHFINNHIIKPQYTLNVLFKTIQNKNHCYTHPLTLRLLMSYIYGAPILDVSRSHTTMHHSR